VKLASRSARSRPGTPDVAKSPVEAWEAENVLERKITRIWTLLSAFEESSAACISDMLLHVSNGAYIEGSLMAAKFIVHVEFLFNAIDQLEVLTVRASGQRNHDFQSSVDHRPAIPKGSKITMSENRQFLLLIQFNVRSRAAKTRHNTRIAKSGHRLGTLSQNPHSISINCIPPTCINKRFHPLICRNKITKTPQH